MRGLFLSLALVVVVLVSVLVSSPAEAQYLNRRGLTIGFGVGGGLIKPDRGDLTGGGWLSFRLGGMLTRRFALMFDNETLFFPVELAYDGRRYRDATGYAGLAGLAMQLFLDPTPIWFKFGAGFSYFGASDGYGTDVGGGGTIGLGIDVFRRRRRRSPMAVSIETQVMPMYVNQFFIAWTVGIGLQWY